ncbi:hypothetical protein HDU97_006473 [Phlyctochytrium planicorne]|nr:hypothetical protein HDU97_006473 [Phlyctochytrium planicorne]
MSYNTHEFRLHSLLTTLLTSLSLPPSLAPTLLPLLLSHPPSTSQSRPSSPSHTLQALLEPLPASQRKKAQDLVEKLKTQQIGELEGFLEVLVGVKEDKGVGRLLERGVGEDVSFGGSSFANQTTLMQTPSHSHISQTPKAMGSLGVGLLSTRTTTAAQPQPTTQLSRDFFHTFTTQSPSVSAASRRRRSMSATNVGEGTKDEQGQTSRSDPHLSSATPSRTAKPAVDDEEKFMTPSNGIGRGRSGSLSRIPGATTIGKRRSSSRLAMEERGGGKELALRPAYPKLGEVETLKTVPIGTYGVDQQETLVMEDLLFVLMGLEGKYIRNGNPPARTEDDGYILPSYVIDDTMDPSLASLAQRIANAAAHYNPVSHFMETHSRFSYGRVVHALVAAMRGVIKDYLVLVAQLEHQIHFAERFGIHKLWFHVGPSLHVLGALGGVVERVRVAEGVGRDESETVLGRNVVGEMRVLFGSGGLGGGGTGVGGFRGGGVVLGVLGDGVVEMGGDPVIKQLHLHLLSSALIPYLESLRRWIHRGEIFDPFDEFLIQERKLHVTKDQISQEDFSDVYWDQRYVLRRDGVPFFLKGLAERVLKAGKYLNVVRECGIEVGEGAEEGRGGEGGEVGDGEAKKEEEVLDEEGGISSSAAFGDIVKIMDGGRIVKDIDLAYRYANETLLKLLMKDGELMHRLRSLKHYFLLSRSDFLQHFLDLAYGELLKPRQDVNLDRVKAMLDLATRHPGTQGDGMEKFRDDLSIEMSGYGLVEQLVRVGGMGAEGGVVGMSASEVLAKESTGKVGLRGIDVVTLSCRCGFPVSLVFNRKVMIKYQMLFRFLLACKRVERVLCLSWVRGGRAGGCGSGSVGRAVLGMVRGSGGAGEEGRKSVGSARSSVSNEGKGRVGVGKGRSGSGSGAMMRAASLGSLSGGVSSPTSFGVGFAGGEEGEEAYRAFVNGFSGHERAVERFAGRIAGVRGRMLHFVQELMQFVCMDVVGVHWEKFERRMGGVGTVDEVLRIHDDFLDSCLKDSLMTSTRLIKLLNAVMTTCLEFSELSEAFCNYRSRRVTRFKLALHAMLTSGSGGRASFGGGGMVGGLVGGDLDDGEVGIGAGGLGGEGVGGRVVAFEEEEEDGGEAKGVGKSSRGEAWLKDIEVREVQGLRAFLNGLRFEGVGGFKGGDGGVVGEGGGEGMSSCLFELVTRLDFNDFYARGFGVGVVG